MTVSTAIKFCPYRTHIFPLFFLNAL